ncbi:tRNA (adenosine(37)-N6)-threonylcarbamoyltransferase complex ATPase subunit type 1 TsaE [Desulfurobacterium atlanticum]|uniref:tRNA threonylcarbamoyladenosine biosynthesis protein TsaE n=1 Tax=Desulfurobacterium atlanticum TaxID=240169 RepID=A0A239AAW5_9BACT|nr:tRNA (adenosine(37)-N6)-threonylcarbamoyltransferase complex ATPase subunit type 1 TsaE [Desulfurobacterium atlanticum]SNR92740.1 tRNA threonylcarbamoyladenosine biosynthesis protein TsaE [Desulfurobacterium atlanticum]
MKIRFYSSSSEETEKIGVLIGQVLPPGSVVLLEGDIGCGKTCFTRGIVAGRGLDREEVSSPSFTIIQEYGDVIHIDLYRLEDEEDIFGVGLEDYLYENNRIKVIEWPQKIGEIFEDFPFPVIKVRCFYKGDGRVFELEGDENLVKSIKKNLLSGGVDVKDS